MPTIKPSTENESSSFTVPGDLSFFYRDPTHAYYLYATYVARCRTQAHERTRYRTPGWPRHKVHPSGAPIMQPYSLTKTVYNYAYGSMERNLGDYGYYYQGYFNGSPIPIGGMSDGAGGATQRQLNELESRARTKFLLAIKDQKVNLVQAYAERHQSANMIATNARRIAEMILALKKGQWRKAADAIGVKVGRRTKAGLNRKFARRQSDAIAAGWLELQYGWKPLLNDIYGSAEAVASAEARDFVGKMITTSKLRVDRSYKTQPEESNFDDYYAQNWEYSIKYTCYYTMAPGILHTMSSVGITNPALIAWELLGYSFVFDWFISVGSYISSWDATAGLTWGSGCVTHSVRAETTRTTVGARNGWSGSVTGSSKTISIDRATLSAFPEAILPNLKNPMGLIHVLNAMALLRKACKSR